MVCIFVKKLGVMLVPCQDSLIRSFSFKSREFFCTVIGDDKTVKMSFELVNGVIVVCLCRGLFDRTVHALDLSVSLWAIRLGFFVSDAVFLTGLVETMSGFAATCAFQDSFGISEL